MNSDSKKEIDFSELRPTFERTFAQAFFMRGRYKRIVEMHGVGFSEEQMQKERDILREIVQSYKKERDALQHLLSELDREVNEKCNP